MTSKRFVFCFTAALTALLLIAVVGNVLYDPYGLFRPSRGRVLELYGEERLTKYLHSFRYVHENFDGVLIGSSVSDAQDTLAIDGYRIYNASINGGNIVDAMGVAGPLYGEGHFRASIVSIHRFLTKDSDAKTSFMQPRQYWSALGSPQLIANYISRMARAAGLTRPGFSLSGSLAEQADPSLANVQREVDKTVKQISAGTSPIGKFQIDPIALDELSKLLEMARSRSDNVYVYFPPIPAPVFALTGNDYRAYVKTIQGLLRPTDQVLDFNAPEFEAFRADLSNFVDGVHLSNRGNTFVLKELGAALHGKSTAVRPGGVGQHAQ